MIELNDGSRNGKTAKVARINYNPAGNGVNSIHWILSSECFPVNSEPSTSEIAKLIIAELGTYQTLTAQSIWQSILFRLASDLATPHL